MSYYRLDRLKGYVARHGVAGAMRRATRPIVDFVRGVAAVIRRPRFDDDIALWKFLESGPGRFFLPSQVPEEILPVLRLVRARAPRVVMEIGTHRGGTLFLWTRVADPRARLISLDLPGGAFGGGYPVWKGWVYRRFVLPGQRIDLIRGDSHRPEALAQVKAALGADSIDFLLIDGDHSYEGVKQDYEMYAPLVRPGGLILFHDIAPHHLESCEVDKCWRELAVREPNATEFIAQPPQGWAGLGLVEKR